MTSFEEILFPHAGYHRAGGFWRCSCLHTYEQIVTNTGGDPDREQENIIAARHAQHLQEVLLKAGAELPKPDPRQALRDRAARRQPEPEVLRDGSLIVPRRR